MNILTAVITSFQAVLALLFEFVPRLLGFLVILLIGWIVASALARAVTFLLRKVGFDRIADRIGLSRLGQQAGIKTDAADILGKLVYWFVFLIFLVPAVNSLGLTTVSDVLGRVIGYLPNVFVAILVLFLGTLAVLDQKGKHLSTQLDRVSMTSIGKGPLSLALHATRAADRRLHDASRRRSCDVG